MVEDPVAILVGSISLKFIDDGDIHDEIAHFGVAHIRSKNFQVIDNGLVTRGGDAECYGMGASGEDRVLNQTASHEPCLAAIEYRLAFESEG
jgi:hypothetical protein